MTKIFPASFTFCVSDCPMAHYAYINNPFTGNCIHCGNHCSSCNLKNGCEICSAAEDSKPFVNLILPLQVIDGNNFYQCTQCGNPKSCKACSQSNVDSCNTDSCRYLGQIGEDCAGSPFNSYFDNCKSGFLNNPNNCTLCGDGYYVNKGLFCSSCQKSNCLECFEEDSGTKQCSMCDQKYSYNQISAECVSCNSQGSGYYQDCEACEIIKKTQTCKACINGFIYVDENNIQRCVSSCPYSPSNYDLQKSGGSFGERTFQERGFQSTSTCKNCHTDCDECVKYGSSYCTSCRKGYYLSLTDLTRSYGTCIEASSSVSALSLYVIPLRTTDYNPHSDSSYGEKTKPFEDLQDAITKAEEYCAVSLTSCQVTIYLLKNQTGDHFLMRKQWNYYKLSKIQKESQLMKLSIEPYYCEGTITADCFNKTLGEKPNIYNKRRDRFQLKVGGGLTLTDINFDSFDSIFDQDQTETCMDQDIQCCKFFNNTLINGASENCMFYEKVKIPSEDCQFTQGGSFIKFDLTPKTILTEPPNLIIKGCEFKNFIYEFNSLIETNYYGGHISITESTFERFGTCGSIIRNFQKPFTIDFTNLIQPYDVYHARLSQLEGQIQTAVKARNNDSFTTSPFITKCTTIAKQVTTNNPACFSLTIRDSFFRYFNYGMTKVGVPVYVNSDYGMQYQGKILQLEAFNGSITISNNTFEHNSLAIESCEAYSTAQNTNLPRKYSFLSKQNNLQIKNLISIRKNQFTVKVLENIFTKNSVIKGLIYIENSKEMSESSNYVVIYGNSINYTASFFDTSAIFVRTESGTNLTEYSPSTTDQPCLGLLVQNNVFKNNFGCPKQGGALIALQCVTSLSTVSSKIESNYDSVEAEQFSSDEMIEKKYLTFNHSSVPTSEVLENIITPSGKQVSIPKYINKLQGNIYERNFGGLKQGLIDITGMIRIYIMDETFKQNGENLVEITNYLRKNYYFVDVEVSPTANLYSYSLANYIQYLYQTTSKNSPQSQPGQTSSTQFSISAPSLMKSMIHYNFGGYILLKNVSVSECFLYEPEFVSMRSVLFYGQKVKGFLDLQTINIKDQVGLMNDFILKEVGADLLKYKDLQNKKEVSYNHYQVSPMFNMFWSTSKLSSFYFNNKLERIKFMKHPGYNGRSDSNMPMFFFIKTDKVDDIKNIQMSSVLLDEGFEMSDVQCISCDQSFAYFAFMTTSFTLFNAKFENVNSIVESSSNEVISGQQQITSQSSYPSLFRIFINDYTGTLEHEIKIKNSSFSNINGGLGSVLQAIMNVPNSKVYIQDSTFTNISSTSGGLITFLAAKETYTYISNSTFNLTTTKGDGGILSTAQADLLKSILENSNQFQLSLKGLNITNSKFYNFINESNYEPRIGHIIYVQQESDFEMILKNNVFDNFQSLTESEMLTKWSSDKSMETFSADSIKKNVYTGSFFWLLTYSRKINVESSYNFYRGAANTIYGGVFNILQPIQSISLFYDEHSIYEYNQAYNGGVITCDGCLNVTFVNSTLRNNRALNGGVYFLNSQSKIYDYNSSYYNNYAQNGAVLYCRNCFGNFLNTSFSENKCKQGCLFFSSEEFVKINVTNSKIFNGYAQKEGSLAYIQKLDYESQSHLNISQSLIVGNKAEEGQVGLIFAEHKQLSISLQNCYFSQNYLENYKSSDAITAQAGYFYLNKAQSLLIDKCIFKGYNSTIIDLFEKDQQNFTGKDTKMYTLLYSQSSANVTIQNTQFSTYSVFNASKVFTEIGILKNPQNSVKKPYFISVIRIDHKDAILFLEQNEFSQNYFTTRGVIDVKNANVTDSKSKYFDNAGTSGAVFYLQDANAKFDSLQVSNNYAQFGGAIYLVDGSNLNVKDTSFSSNYALKQGGTIMIIRLSLDRRENNVNFTNTKITGSYAQAEGGTLYLENDGVLVSFDGCIIENTTARDSAGGFAQIVKGRNLQIIDSSITQSLSKEAQLMKIVPSSSLPMKVNIKRSHFKCSIEQFDFQKVKAMLSNQTSTSGSAIYLKSVVEFNLYESTFQQCLFADKGGVIRIEESNMTDYYSEFYYNSALQGGVIKATGSNIVLNRTYFRQNYAREGGVIMMDNQAYLYAYLIKAEKNFAQTTAGVMQVLTYSTIEVYDSQFYENEADQASCLNILQPATNREMRIWNSKFTSNIALKNTIQLMYAYNITIKKTQFLKNQATQLSKNLFFGFSNISIESCTFEDQLLSRQGTTLQTKGSFIHLIMSVYLNISGSSFVNGFSQMGGAIYLSGESSCHVTRSQFINNYASEKGGALYLSTFSDFKIASVTLFSRNFAVIDGSDIYAINAEQNLTLENVQINNEATNSIYLEQVGFFGKSISIKRSKKLNSYFKNGGAIYGYDLPNFMLQDSQIQDSKSEEGGALTLEQTQYSKDFMTKKDFRYYQIFDCTFINNNATLGSGGALNIINSKSMLISRSTFTSNSASVKGGAIKFSCEQQTYDCSLELTGTNIFSTNWAGESGGAIFWGDVEPVISSSTIYRSNQALIYANDIGSIPAMLVQMNETQFKSQMLRANPDKSIPYESFRRILQADTVGSKNQTEGKEDGLQSGSSIKPIYVGLADKYGQIVGTSSNSKLQIQIDESYKSTKNATLYTPNVAGTTNFYSEKGVFKIENIQFTGTPGAKYKLKFVTDAIDITKPSNQEMSKQQNSGQSTSKNNSLNIAKGLETSLMNSIDFQLDIQVRKCISGEKFTDSGQCITCPANSSFSIATMDKPGECQKCPTEQAICYGGSFIGPQPGYWRKSNESYRFIKCVNPSSCLGIIPPKYILTGQCEEGYKGILCSDCDPGYSRTSSFQCSKCPNQTSNVVKIVAIIIVFTVVLMFMIRSTLNGASERRNITSVFQKILLNHIQLVVLTSSFDFKWPDSVSGFFKINEPVGEAATEIFSIDCLAADYLSFKKDEKADNQFFRIFYMKLLMFFILPILLAFLSFGFWWLVSKNDAAGKQLLKTKAISTVVILLFFVHPNIVKQVFQTFYCLDIDGENRLKYDLEIKCYQGPHQFWSMAVAIPGMIIWGFGIPLFALGLLVYEQNKLDKLEIRQKLGFLFRGYTLKFYFWEIVIMFRKIVLILIQSFLVQFGILVQALVVFVLLIVFVVVTMTKQPFQTMVLNRLEIMSLLASMITVYCGIFYIVDISQTDASSGSTTEATGVKLDESTRLFFFFSILISNLAFLIYWAFMVYFEVKSMLIKKLGKLYVIFCLCGNHEKLGRLLEEIQINEENETLREKFVDMVDDIKQLYYDGKLILNYKNIEKVNLYLQQDKVLKAAGIDPDLIALKERNDKRHRRKYITQNLNKMVLQKQMESEDIANHLKQNNFDPEGKFNNSNIYSMNISADLHVELDTQRDQNQQQDQQNKEETTFLKEIKPELNQNSFDSSSDNQDNPQNEEDYLSMASLDSIEKQILKLEKQLTMLNSPIKGSIQNIHSQSFQIDFHTFQDDSANKSMVDFLHDQQSSPRDQQHLPFSPSHVDLINELNNLRLEKQRLLFDKHNDSRLPVHVQKRHEKNLNRRQAERDKRRQRLEEERMEKGYKKLRKRGSLKRRASSIMNQGNANANQERQMMSRGKSPRGSLINLGGQDLDEAAFEVQSPFQFVEKNQNSPNIEGGDFKLSLIQIQKLNQSQQDEEAQIESGSRPIFLNRQNIQHEENLFQSPEKRGENQLGDNNQTLEVIEEFNANS